MLIYDFSGIDQVARQIYKKQGEHFEQLNPSGFFLANKASVTLKVEDDSVFNHIVISISAKEITIRPGVRAH